VGKNGGHLGPGEGGHVSAGGGQVGQGIGSRRFNQKKGWPDVQGNKGQWEHRAGMVTGSHNCNVEGVCGGGGQRVCGKGTMGRT